LRRCAPTRQGSREEWPYTTRANRNLLRPDRRYSAEARRVRSIAYSRPSPEPKGMHVSARVKRLNRSDKNFFRKIHGFLWRLKRSFSSAARFLPPLLVYPQTERARASGSILASETMSRLLHPRPAPLLSSIPPARRARRRAGCAAILLLVCAHPLFRGARRGPVRSSRARLPQSSHARTTLSAGVE
jgi:hypothetical protein